LIFHSTGENKHSVDHRIQFGGMTQQFVAAKKGNFFFFPRKFLSSHFVCINSKNKNYYAGKCGYAELCGKMRTACAPPRLGGTCFDAHPGFGKYKDIFMRNPFATDEGFRTASMVTDAFSTILDCCFFVEALCGWSEAFEASGCRRLWS